MSSTLPPTSRALRSLSTMASAPRWRPIWIWTRVLSIWCHSSLSTVTWSTMRMSSQAYYRRYCVGSTSGLRRNCCKRVPSLRSFCPKRWHVFSQAAHVGFPIWSSRSSPSNGSVGSEARVRMDMVVAQ
ncbi:hypothetical protein BCR44DRAFT_1428502 [Catenaria anguillulae PL171]|uniref:Uncharacterized protein n=1 Tax=Catenaria anguillulae PL171 TaxID=765915 RepID=A0A1Y2HVC1_9FUNG|nr:hypothetical protein BCR44DRAFT_1428502 [Catenaria anguillulae PL171]